jgi:hypothetical protein
MIQLVHEMFGLEAFTLLNAQFCSIGEQLCNARNDFSRIESVCCHLLIISLPKTMVPSLTLNV